jgi:hypothetical protein
MAESLFCQIQVFQLRTIWSWIIAAKLVHPREIAQKFIISEREIFPRLGVYNGHDGEIYSAQGPYIPGKSFPGANKSVSFPCALCKSSYARMPFYLFCHLRVCLSFLIYLFFFPDLDVKEQLVLRERAWQQRAPGVIKINARGLSPAVAAAQEICTCSRNL